MLQKFLLLSLALVCVQGCVFFSVSYDEQILTCNRNDDCPSPLRCSLGNEGGFCIDPDNGDCGNTTRSGNEECDDGNRIDGDGCDGTCIIERCGNGVVQFGEVCDDNNVISGDGCRSDCAKLETCGDGEVDFGEECDDGNLSNEDVCTNVCGINVCGDGFVFHGVEVCDDANSPDGGCSDDCLKVEECGDGFLDAGEECDDGNYNPHDSCSNECENVSWSAEVLIGAGVQPAESLASDSIAPLATSLHTPVDIVRGPDGSIYITATCAIYRLRLEPTPALIRFVGTGICGNNGNDEPPALTQVVWTDSVVVDDFGTMYFSERFGYRIRKVKDGVVSTVAGTDAGFSGDDGPATAAMLGAPRGLALHGNDLYFADQANHRIRKIDLGTGIISTVAGT